ncbi:MAG: sugar-binding protein [Bacteroidia bacterium]
MDAPSLKLRDIFIDPASQNAQLNRDVCNTPLSLRSFLHFLLERSRKLSGLRLYVLLFFFPFSLLAQNAQLPYLSEAPIIDGNLHEWQDSAFHDGLWDLARVAQAPWYNPKRNRLTQHSELDSLHQDLQARYYMAWDDSSLYLGAIVHDNFNDVSESRHAPKRWYYKDAISFFIEAPLDTIDETFSAGNHGFSFVIDTTFPDYGAWWRRGDPDTTFLETPLPTQAVEYKIRFTNATTYILEARIDMRQTFATSDPLWRSPQEGDQYSFMIVHCDPDGGEYGGHLLIHGKGDPDQSWTPIQLVRDLPSLLRKPK